MTTAEIVALFARRADAFSRHDAVTLAATHAEAGILLSPTAGTIVGRNAIENVYRLWFSAFPDLRMEVEDLLIAGDRVVQTVTVSGTDVGGFLGLPPTGRTVRVEGAFVYALQDCLILHERRILDMSGVLLQLAGEVAAVLVRRSARIAACSPLTSWLAKSRQPETVSACTARRSREHEWSTS